MNNKMFSPHHFSMGKWRTFMKLTLENLTRLALMILMVVLERKIALKLSLQHAFYPLTKFNS